MTQRTLALVYDTEANGFYENADTVWCLVAKDIITGESWEWGHADGILQFREEIRALFRRAKVVCAHNEIKHDLPQLYKLGILCPRDYEGAKCYDTFTISSLLNPDRRTPPGARGAHGLEAWGIRMNIFKPGHEDWTQFSQEMMHRCRMDVEINYRTWKQLQHEVREDDWPWARSIRVEHDWAWVIAQQERVGWFYMRDNAIAALKELDEEIKAVDDQLDPMLPLRCIQGTTFKSLYLKSGKYNSRVCKYFDVSPEDAMKEFPPISFDLDALKEAGSQWLRKNKVSAFAKKVSRMNEDGVAVKDENGKIIKDEIMIEDPEQLLQHGIDQWIKENGLLTPVSFEQMERTSQNQVKEFLLTQGWVPDEMTPAGNPRMTESSLGTISGPAGKLLAKRFVLLHRRNTIENVKDPENKGWMSMVRPDGRIPAECNPCGTPTGRARHKKIVNVPRVTSDYGHLLRQCFGVPEGRTLLGYDSSGLELRCFAHYINSQEYTRILLEEDIHTFNQMKAGLSSRNDAKTFIYALLYGAGDLKIGRIIGGNSTQGKELRYKFFQNLPELEILMKRIKHFAGRGYLRGLDDRKLMVRSEHSALNTLLQGAGAIVMKFAGLNLERWLCDEGYKKPARLMTDIYAPNDPVKKVGDIHDESQLDIDSNLIIYDKFEGWESQADLWLPDQRVWSAPHGIQVEKLENPETGKEEKYGLWERGYARPGELAVLAMRQAGTDLNFNCPLDAEYKLGRSWADTH